ncbi:DUF2505 domain-containing protein [Nocardioides mangrovicus]|uniref:DUF2505 domain-containing protein n=1 Tax=Nocardioides mangrovicus TaxID=2478913 RepID=A0A3L8P475_9ACTN|nr:DUF2505 domain-containing protein [Nocardioides mangrovicus]RLV49874.1 DUF2505 domain-containing protein [Nocardioides mangrovicus]
MTKTIDHALTYEGASAEQVYAMLGDEKFRNLVCDAQRVIRKDVSITPAGEGMTVRIEQVQTAQGIPSFATKFVGEEITILQEEQWASPTQGTVHVSIPGKPGEMNGTITISESGGTTTETVHMDCKVSIPLVGGKIEGLLVDLLTKALKAENRVGRDYLA